LKPHIAPIARVTYLYYDMIDPFSRYQRNFCILEIYPDPVDRVCGCGCERPLTGRKRKWATGACLLSALTVYGIIKGDTFVVRREVYRRDQGFCRHCGALDENWEADHIIPVHKGGGGCDLSNFQTLCKDCHKAKNRHEARMGAGIVSHTLKISLQVDSTRENMLM